MTGWVTLQCAPNLKAGRFENCHGYHYGGAAERPDLQAAFEQAAVRVIGVIRLKTKLAPNDSVLPPAGFYTIEFNDHPHMPGDLPSGPPVTRFPDFLPGPGGKIAAPAAVKTPASYAPEHYILPPRAAELRTRLNGLQSAAFRSIWIKKPTGDDLVALYPPEAAKANVSAALTMTCRIGGEGLLYECGVGPVDLSADSVTSITPATAGEFKAAAIRMASLFQMDPGQIAEAGGTDGMIRIPIRFSLPRPAQSATPS